MKHMLYVQILSTMLNWKRPRGMPINQPTEEQIWDTIEKQGQQSNITTNDRLAWHQEMLEDRDIYEDSFPRSSRIPAFESELPSKYDPADWVIKMNLRHSHDPPLEKIVDHLCTGKQNVLQPVMDGASNIGTINLLAYHILRKKTEDWKPQSTFGTPLKPISGYTEWARYHLRIHHAVLKKAGIFHAIYVSLFEYDRLPFAWIRTIAEHWDNKTNTCWVGPHELTMTLTDMQDIAGLPVIGTPYEECIPPDCELFERKNTNRQGKGNFKYPDELHQALAHYQKLLGNAKGRRKKSGVVTLDMWSNNFLQKKACSLHKARLSDPFELEEYTSEISLKSKFEPEGGVNAQNILALNIDDDLSLIAFIATWLCYFVFPGYNRTFRPATLLMASLISRGERIALAPAALAYLYHGLGLVSTVEDSRKYDVEAPWHYLQGWVYTHISGSFSLAEVPAYYKDNRYPIILNLSNATAIADVSQIRTFMFAPIRMMDQFEVIHQSKANNLHTMCFDKMFKDDLITGNVPLLLSKQTYQSIAEYLIALRPAWLCYRRHETVIIKVYNPNRVARQFGFVQAKPIFELPRIPNVDDVRSLRKLPVITRLKAASMTWAFILRLGTGSRFFIAPKEASTGVSHFWLLWIRHTFSAFLNMGFRVYSGGICRQSHIEHAPIARTMSKKEDSHKRHRDSSPSHNGHKSSSEHNSKKSKNTSPLSKRKTGHSKFFSQEPESNTTPFNISPVDNEDIMIEEVVTDKVTNDEENIAFAPVHWNMKDNNFIPSYEEPQRNENIYHINPEYCNEVLADTSASTHVLAHISSRKSLIEDDESQNTSEPLERINSTSEDLHLNAPETEKNIEERSIIATISEVPLSNLSQLGAEGQSMLESSETTNSISPDHYLDVPNTDKNNGEQNAVTVVEEIPLLNLVQPENKCMSEEQQQTPIIETEEQPLIQLEDSTEWISGWEMSGFISQIQFRDIALSQKRPTKGMSHIVTAIQELILGVNREMLPELSEFCNDANSLLDCAVITGMSSQELQRWDSVLREIEFGIYSLQISNERRLLEENNAAEIALKNITEQVGSVIKELKVHRQTVEDHQQKIMCANDEIISITAELEALEQKKQCLMQKREAVSHDISIMHGNCQSAKDRVVELELLSEPLLLEREVAAQRLQISQEQYKQEIARTKAAIMRIDKVQAECA